MLLETLVAFAIAAMALVVLYRGGIEGLNGTRTAERTEEAVARARSRIDALCHGARLAPGHASGDDGSGFTWYSDTARAGGTLVNRGSADDPKPPLRAELFAVRVTVSWPGTIRPHQVALATDCLAVTPLEGG